MGGSEAGMFAVVADEDAEVVDAAVDEAPLPPRPCFAGLPLGRCPRPLPGLPTKDDGGDGCEEDSATWLEDVLAPAAVEAAFADLLLVLVLRVLPVGAISACCCCCCCLCQNCCI